MASAFNDDNEEITGINVTPLVDVMLVLLIIFMVTTSYIVTNAIDLSLPEAESGEVQESEQAHFNFEINRDSKVFFNGKEITIEQVPEIIARYKQEHPDQAKSLQALISADKNISHGLVINLIDTIRKNGITNFAIDVEAPSHAAGK